MDSGSSAPSGRRGCSGSCRERPPGPGEWHYTLHRPPGNGGSGRGVGLPGRYAGGILLPPASGLRMTSFGSKGGPADAVRSTLEEQK